MIADRTNEITSFIVMDVLEKAGEMMRQGIDVIHLEVGEPDFDTPNCVKVASQKALQDGHTHYTHSLGMVELREAISEYYNDCYGVNVDPDCVVVASGTSPAMFALFGSILNPGDEVIISDPHYACYPNFIRFMQAIPVTVPVYEEEGFQYTPEAIKEKLSPKTKGIFINSPSNPAGTLLSGERMEQIVELGKYVISDEIYHGLVYGEKEHSILEYTDKAFVFNGFSKLYAMTGLRLGYLIAPKEFIRPIQKVMQNFFISANSMVQVAGVAALKEAGDDVRMMNETYNERRIYMLKRLRGMGFDIKVEPTGAFYVLVNMRHISMDSYKLAFDILEKAHVGVTPGIDFGANCEGFIRFSYANSIQNIEIAMDRLEKYFKEFEGID